MQDHAHHEQEIAVLTAKVAAMNESERDARFAELNRQPEKTYAERLEWTKLMFGEDMGLENG